MEAHLPSLHDSMTDVLECGPIIHMINNVNYKEEYGAEMGELIPKDIALFTPEERKLHNLDRVARNTILTTLSDSYLGRVQDCKSAKELWDALALLSRGTQKIKDNKLALELQKLDILTLQSNERIEDLNVRFTNLINTINGLRKSFSNWEMNMKILRALPDGRWTSFATYLRHSDLDFVSPDHIFEGLDEEIIPSSLDSL